MSAAAAARVAAGASRLGAGWLRTAALGRGAAAAARSTARLGFGATRWTSGGAFSPSPPPQAQSAEARLAAAANAAPASPPPRARDSAGSLLRWFLPLSAITAVVTPLVPDDSPAAAAARVRRKEVAVALDRAAWRGGDDYGRRTSSPAIRTHSPPSACTCCR